MHLLQEKCNNPRKEVDDYSILVNADIGANDPLNKF